LLAQDERMREDFIARLDRIAADLQIEQQQHAITANQRDEARSRLHASHIERDDLEARLARVVEALDWYDSATKNPDFWCPVKQGFFAPRYHSEDVECSGCGQWFAVERGVHDDAEVDHFFSLIRAAAKGEPSGD
jgi:formylmethanofuran dehydrogenase subunit E